MKKLMFLLMTLLLVVFTAWNSSAQGNKTQNCFTDDGSFYFYCVDEIVVGSLEYCWTFWDGKTQVKYKGTFVGEDTGLTYTFSLVENVMWKEWVEGQAYVGSDNGTAVIECEGVPVGITKLRSHFVVNANGDMVLDKYEVSEWECL